MLQLTSLRIYLCPLAFLKECSRSIIAWSKVSNNFLLEGGRSLSENVPWVDLPLATDERLHFPTPSTSQKVGSVESDANRLQIQFLIIWHICTCIPFLCYTPSQKLFWERQEKRRGREWIEEKKNLVTVHLVSQFSITGLWVSS